MNNNTTASIIPVLCYGEILRDILPEGPQPGALLNVAYYLNRLVTRIYNT